jgi:TRAP-type C4-dicarboxylate transport system permease small subunit
LLLLKASFRFVASEKSFGTAVFENFPVWIFQTIFVITFCLMTFRFALNILDNIKSLLTKEKLN